MPAPRHHSPLLPAALAAAVLALAAAPPAGAVASEWQENDQSRVRLVTPFDVAPAEGPIRLGLHFETLPGWHVYWKNSGDAGYPPALDLAATPELSGVELLWPAPERYELPGDLVAFGYEGEVVYPVAARIGAAGRRRITLTAEVDYLVCEVECIPYRYRLTVEQPVAGPGDSPMPDAATAPLLAEWGARVPEPVAAVEGITSEAAVDWSDAERPEIEVVVTGAGPAPGGEPQVFFGPSDTYGTGTPRLLDAGAAAGTLRFRVPLELLAVPDEPPATLPLAWVVTGLVPTVLAGGAGSGRPLAIEAAGDVPVLTEDSPVLGTDAARRLRPAELGRILLMALAGGVIVHLMPTLLPLLLLGLLVLRPVQASHGRLTARVALATAAGAFAGALALGAAALAAHRAGMPAAWGSQLQEPVLVALLAIVVTLVALNLWGLFPAPLRFPGADERPGASLGGRAALLRGAGLGLVTALLALPWNPPLLAPSLGPAVRAGVVPALAAFAALGAGLALPWLLVAARPELLRRAPRARFAPDGWGRHLAEALAFLEVGSVLWLLYVLARQVSPEALAFLQLALLGLALATWLRHGARRRGPAVALAALMLVLAATILWLADSNRLGPAANRGGTLEANTTTGD